MQSLSRPNEPLILEAMNALKNDFTATEVDFFRPWRFGAPKPDKKLHLEFRDQLQTTKVKP